MNITETIESIISVPLEIRGPGKIFRVFTNDMIVADGEIDRIIERYTKTLKSETIELIKIDLTSTDQAATILNAIRDRGGAKTTTRKSVFCIFESITPMNSDIRFMQVFMAARLIKYAGLIYVTTAPEIGDNIAPVIEQMDASPSLAQANNILVNTLLKLKCAQDDEFIKLVSTLELMTSPSKVFSLINRTYERLIKTAPSDQIDIKLIKELDEARLAAINEIPTMKIEEPVAESDIVGLDDVKTWLRTRFNHPLLGKPPKGVLILGVPGTGKSMLVKAAGSILNRRIVRYNPSAVYDKRVGSSEANLRRDLEIIDNLGDVIIFVDEIEKQLSGINSSGDTDGGITSRIIGNIISWTQDRKSSAFLMATANSFDGLPPELLRADRFDDIFFVDLPGKTDKMAMFKLYLNKYIPTHKLKDADIEEVVDMADRFSGADIKAAVIDTYYKAFIAENKKKTTLELLIDTVGNAKPFAVKFPARMDTLYQQKEVFRTVTVK